LHWCADVPLAWGSGWIAAAAALPVAMLLLILFVSGIPPTEAQAVRSRGDDYRAYQRTTSAFFPWPPRTQTP
jgi:steroid 5-alpha reductase family enzyme